MASGNVVHNLRAISWGDQGRGFEWAQRFDDAAFDIMTGSPDRIGELVDHDDFRRAVPTPDHFLPLIYLAGIANATGRSARSLVRGCDMGSLSMTSYEVPAA